MAKQQPDAKPEQASPPRNIEGIRGMAVQGWISLAVWMTIGLLLEGLLAFRAPGYLDDPQRRELFRLAHAHGAMLGLLLLAAAWCAERFAHPGRPAVLALRLGALLMPLAFFLAGLQHPEGDPGLAIWLAPPGAVLIIFAAVSMALASRSSD
ncbi:MAG: hypothetical protein SF339_28725 [Blastocatellia bacterium]|nr:hypothetical protein [Blastocatellia bacterium]